MIQPRALFFTVILTMLCMVAAASAAENKPARGFDASFEYPGMTVGLDEDVRLDILTKNTGRSSETVLFSIVEKPEGWRTYIKNLGNVVNGIFLLEDAERILIFTAEPEEGVKKAPGTYTFTLQARSKDGAIKKTSSVDVVIAEQKQTENSIQLTTSYPVLRGPSDSKFEFSIDVKNNTGEDGLFNLRSAAPEGWDVSFKPSYERKQISSLRIQAGDSQTVGVDVTPARDASAGEYPVTAVVSSADAEAEAQLKVTLTGTYEIELATVDGLLSLTAKPGKESFISLYVKNLGSADLPEVDFMSFKPENWEVTFEPEIVENLKAGDIGQVEVSVVPSDEALVGDYSVDIAARAGKAEDDVEMRVTVKASTAWGWIGALIIVLVFVGLGYAFKRFGRR